MATVKQKLAFKEVLKGSPIGKAMEKVGYAKTTASTTGKLTSSDGWRELVEKTLSDKALLKVHREGLAATRIIPTEDGEPIETPDFAVRHKYLETGYKIKSRLNPEGDSANKTLIVIVAGESAQRYGVSTSSEPR